MKPEGRFVFAIILHNVKNNELFSDHHHINVTHTRYQLQSVGFGTQPHSAKASELHLGLLIKPSPLWGRGPHTFKTFQRPTLDSMF